MIFQDTLTVCVSRWLKKGSIIKAPDTIYGGDLFFCNPDDLPSIENMAAQNGIALVVYGKRHADEPMLSQQSDLTGDEPMLGSHNVRLDED